MGRRFLATLHTRSGCRRVDFTDQAAAKFEWLIVVKRIAQDVPDKADETSHQAEQQVNRRHRPLDNIVSLSLSDVHKPERTVDTFNLLVLRRCAPRFKYEGCAVCSSVYVFKDTKIEAYVVIDAAHLLAQTKT